MLSTLYNTIEKKSEWLDGAKKGFDFVNKHCFDTDGQMFFHVTKDGRPIRKRRYPLVRWNRCGKSNQYGTIILEDEALLG
jgi:hypothetical protein